MTRTDPLNARRPLPGVDGVEYFALAACDEAGIDTSKLPYTVRVLLEMQLRHSTGPHVSEADIRALAAWPAPAPEGTSVPFIPSRVILQDFTGIPTIADLAAMRDAHAKLGGDPGAIDPLVPVDLVIDHSVQVDTFGTKYAFEKNVEREYERNGERYRFFRWGQGAFGRLRVVPPGMGIVHQVNVEHLASVVDVREVDGHERVDGIGVAAELRVRIAHRGEVGDGRDAGEVLQDHARRDERHGRAFGRGRGPRGERADVGLGHVRSGRVAQLHLEQHAHGVRQLRGVDTGLVAGGQGEVVDAVDARKRTAGVEGIGARHPGIMPRGRGQARRPKPGPIRPATAPISAVPTISAGTGTPRRCSANTTIAMAAASRSTPPFCSSAWSAR
jgi:hypothetical protein